MKRTFFYCLLALPFVVMLGGCLKASQQENTPLPQISGNFIGQFTRLRLNKTTNKYDTLRATVNLNLDLTTGYALTGDTTLNQSRGDFSYDYFYFQFDDETYPTTGYPKKPHLAGLYQYNYNNGKLVMQQVYPLDTLGYFYNLQKTN